MGRRDDVGKGTRINIYTDGFKLDNKIRGGVLSAKLDTKNAFCLPYHCSVFQEDIKEGLLALTKVVQTTRNIFTYIHSQADY